MLLCGWVQRVLLLSYDKDTKRISFRHYGISAQPSGVSKSVKSLVGRRQLPDMGTLGDVSEFLTKSGYGSVTYPASCTEHSHLRPLTKALKVPRQAQGCLALATASALPSTLQCWSLPYK